MPMNTMVVLKNGFRFQGKIIHETESEIVLDEIKNGEIVIDKASIVARTYRRDLDGFGERKALE